MLTYDGSQETLVHFADSVNIYPSDIVRLSNYPEVQKVALNNLFHDQQVVPQFRYRQDLLQRFVSRRQQIQDYGHYILSHLHYRDGLTAVLLGNFVRNLIENRLQAANQLCALAESILAGDDTTTSIIAQSFYRHPSSEDVRTAHSILECYQRPITESQLNQQIYSDQQIANVLQRTLASYDLPGWSAQVCCCSRSIHIDKHCFQIPLRQNLAENNLAKLIGCKIESHIRGEANVRALLVRILGEDTTLLPLVPWLSTSYRCEVCEGAAKISDPTMAPQISQGVVEQPSPWPVLGYEYINTGHHDFNETLFWFFEHFSKYQNRRCAAKNAWRRAYGLFRGCTDASNRHYNFAKHASCLIGYNKLRKLADPEPELYQLALDFSSLSLSELKFLLNAWRLAEAEPKQIITLRNNNVRIVSTLLFPRYPNLELATHLSLVTT